MIPIPTTIDATTAKHSGDVVMLKNHAGYTGNGFADGGGKGSWIEPSYSAAAAGNVTLAVRYAAANARPLAVLVNGKQVATLACPQTKDWDTWSIASTTIALVTGTNAVRLVATGDNGAPNFDSFTFTPAAATTNSGTIGQTTGNTPQSAGPDWANGIGACFSVGIDAKDDTIAAATVSKAKAFGLTLLRTFGPSCNLGGSLDAGYSNQVRRITSRGIRVVVMHGAPESDAAHTTYAEDDWKRYFDAVAKARNGDELYEVELQNEMNLPKYWPLGQNAAFSAAAVAKMIIIAKIARASLGNNCRIIGPSIGWDDAVDPHLTYQKAFIDGGGINYVDAINTHLYFKQASQTADVLEQYRAWVGPTKLIYSTEFNVNVLLTQYAATAPAFIAPMRAAGVTPMVYRFDQQPGNAWNDRSLHDAGGNPNAIVATALKLRAAA